MLTQGTGAVEHLVWGNPQGQWPLAGVGEAGEERMWVAVEGLLVGVLEDGIATPAASDGRGDLVMLGDSLLGGADAFGSERDDVAATSARFVYAGLASLGDRPQLLAWHRVYDPELGRFMSQDPLGLDGGFHRFTYAENRPTTLVDPEGLTAVELGALDWVGGVSAQVAITGVYSPVPTHLPDGTCGLGCVNVDGGRGVVEVEIDGPDEGWVDADGASKAGPSGYGNEEEGMVYVIVGRVGPRPHNVPGARSSFGLDELSALNAEVDRAMTPRDAAPRPSPVQELLDAVRGISDASAGFRDALAIDVAQSALDPAGAVGHQGARNLSGNLGAFVEDRVARGSRAYRAGAVGGHLAGIGIAVVELNVGAIAVGGSGGVAAAGVASGPGGAVLVPAAVAGATQGVVVAGHGVALGTVAARNLGVVLAASSGEPGSGTHRAGAEKAWRSGAEPNSKWTQTSRDGKKAVQNTVYDADGNAVGQVDFKQHGPGAPPGHGHSFPPGQPAAGHGPGTTHLDPADVPEGWADIPPGLRPAQSLGQP